MFAYCNNNPVNACDKNGKAPDTLAGWIGEELGKLIYEWFEEETEEDKEKIADGTVSYSSKGKGNGASIYNSHEIDTPWVMYQYVAANRGDEIGGTTIGVVVEWIFHNTAYEAGTALNIERISNPAEHLDVGNTIYSDRRSGFSLELMMSLGMQLIYTVFLPIPAAYDLGVETGRWDHVYPRE